MKQVTKEEFHIELQIPKDLIKENCQMDINFLIIINNNFPLSSPKTYCITGVKKFSKKILVLLSQYIRWSQFKQSYFGGK